MKILAAFDSFKESMSAYKAGEAVKEAAKDHIVTIVPMADGGEGTMEAMNVSLQGDIHTIEVTGPLGKKVQAKLSICDNLAIIEAAQACGLDLLLEEEKDALHTTTYGMGEMIVYAYKLGCRKFILTLGGSSTNDGGIGMLSALGYRFLDKNGDSVELNASGLGKICSIENHSHIKDIEVIAACDVTNPLLGKQGASYIFGPQKGLKDLEKTDQDMKHYASLSEQFFNKQTKDIPGTGAAGGLGFAIMTYLNGTLQPGFDIVAQYVSLEKHIQENDIIFTGEGSCDHQTLFGKTPKGILDLCLKYNKPVVVFAGRVQDKELLIQAGFQDVRCINHEDLPLEELLKNGQKNLEKEVYTYLHESQ